MFERVICFRVHSSERPIQPVGKIRKWNFVCLGIFLEPPLFVPIYLFLCNYVYLVNKSWTFTY